MKNGHRNLEKSAGRWNNNGKKIPKFIITAVVVMFSVTIFLNSKYDKAVSEI